MARIEVFAHVHIFDEAMLVLSRRNRTNPSSSVTTSSSRLLTIRGDKVRLGFDAPKDVPVHRQEVYEAIKRENEQVENQDSRPDS